MVGDDVFIKNSVVYYHHSFTTGGCEWCETIITEKEIEIEKLKRMFKNIRNEECKIKKGFQYRVG